jgi:MATE family multidrug resistance protein
MWRLSLPMIGSLVAEPLTGMVDSVLIARLGASPLAALGVAVPLLSTLLFAFNFLGIGTQTIVARSLGEGRRERAGEAAGLSMALGLAFGGALALVGLALARPAAAWMGAEGATLDGAVAYLDIRLLGAPAVLVTMAAFGALRGLQDVRTPLWIAIATNIANLVLDIVLIFGAGPFPALGLVGAAWASTIALWLGAGLALSSVATKLGLTRHIAWSDTGQLLVVGFDLFLRSALLLLFVTLAGRAATRIGTEAGAAHTLIRSVWMLTAFLLDAYAVVAQSLVGYFVGAARSDLARRVARSCLQWSVATGVAAGAAMLLGTPWLMAALPEAARPLAGGAWAIAALSQPFSAVSFGTDGIHWGTGDYRFLRNAMLLSTGAGAALLLGLDASGRATLEGVWIVTTVWIALRSAAGTLRVWPGIGGAPLAKA